MRNCLRCTFEPFPLGPIHRTRLILPPLASPAFNAIICNALDLPLTGDHLQVPATIGQGTLMRKEIDAAVHMIFWKYKLAARLSVQQAKQVAALHHPALTLLYILIEGDLHRSSPPAEKRVHQLQTGRTIVLVSDKTDLRFEVPAGQLIKVVGISANFLWLQREFSGEGEMYSTFLRDLYEKASKGPQLYSTSMDDLSLLTETTRLAAITTGPALSFKANVYMLLSHFFHRLTTAKKDDDDNTKSLYYQQLTAFRDMLENNVENKLPPLPELAKKAGLGASTLKRNFKLVFGKNIYQYYLGLKMKHAWQLITEQGLSVKEAAHRLNYENVSGFIEIFRKFHGDSPGNLIKQQTKPKQLDPNADIYGKS